MKVVQKSQNGKMLKLSDASLDRDTWFFMSDKVKEYAEKNNVNVGSEVKVNTENKNGSKTITFLSLESGSPTTSTSQYHSQTTTSRPKYQSRDQETQESIIRQSTMASASRCVRACQGMVSTDDVADVTIAVYNKLLAEIKK